MRNFELVVYKLIARETELQDLEEWVYQARELEDTLSSDDYLELISLNYNQPSALYEADKILRPYIDIGKYWEWNLRNALQKIIDRTDDVSKYLVQCYDLYCDGYSFLDNLGLGYGLSVVVPPYGCNDETEKANLIDSFYPAVSNEASKVIDWLDSGKIVITGHDGSYQGVEYDDKRSSGEKEPTGYKVAQPTKKWWKFW